MGRLDIVEALTGLTGRGGCVPSIVVIADFDPEPIRKGDQTAQSYRWEGGDGPWRGEEEEI